MALGFGIVGTGMISRFHAKALAEVRGAKLVACAGTSLAKAKEFAKHHPCTAHPSLEALLADIAVDAVIVATPSGAHMEPAVAAARAGKHVIVEKPLEVTLKRCDRIIEACEKAGVRLGAIFPSRFHEGAKLMKQAVDAGRFGRMTLGDAYVKWHRTQQYYDSGAWRGTWKLDGGGALMNQAIHSVDLLQWFMGPVVEVAAQVATLAHDRIEVEDVATANLRFASGALGVIEATTAAYPGYLKRIDVHGSEGSATLEEEALRRWDFAKKSRTDATVRRKMALEGTTGGGAGDPAAIGHRGHMLQLQDFVDAIRKDRPAAVDGAEGRKAVEIVLAIYQSAATGKRVTLPLKGDAKAVVPEPKALGAGARPPVAAL